MFGWCTINDDSAARPSNMRLIYLHLFLHGILRGCVLLEVTVIKAAVLVLIGEKR